MLSMDGRGVVENGENDVVEEGWRLIRTAVIILARIIQTALSPMREAPSPPDVRRRRLGVNIL